MAVVLTACTSEPDTKDQSEETSAPPSGPCEVAPEDGDVIHSITVGGEERQYRLFAPEGLPTDTRVPVVYLFHGLGQNPEDAVKYTAFDKAADEHGFIVVAPLGGDEGPGWDIASTVNAKGSDLGFVKALTDAVVERHCADPERQYAAGMSNGSALLFAAACSGDFPFAAYGGVAYLTYGPGCDTVPPTSFIYFHGSSDVAVPYTGGATPLGVAEPVTETLSAWVTKDECGDPQDYEEPAADIQHWTWGCADDARIEAFVVLGGGHTWPGATGVGGQGQTTTSIQATVEMVRFFGLADQG
ncbi:PHB depolymerase family esterase [Aeromicrobium alkaliterrae]|uniref:PHB depolymerase family esterase n=1 Tax=Aeromicrobium alkaliterrae TaxID=302168 RepID=A0ABP4VYX2_9ACTN